MLFLEEYILRAFVVKKNSECNRRVYLLINFKFRCIPLNLLRLNGESLKIFLNDSSLIASHSLVLRSSMPGIGSNAGSACGLLNLFHGHTSWQVSHPNIQLSDFPFISSGISMSLSSIVKKEIHLLPSTIWRGISRWLDRLQDTWAGSAKIFCKGTSYSIQNQW